MSAVNPVARFRETAALLGGRTGRSGGAARRQVCSLVSGSSHTRTRYWNWFDKLRFHVFG